MKALSSLLLLVFSTQALAVPLMLPDRITGSAPLDPAQYPYLDTKFFRDQYGFDLNYATFFDLRDNATMGQYVGVGSAGGDVGRVLVGTVPQNHLCASNVNAAQNCFYSLSINGLRSKITSRTEGILVQAVEVARPLSEGDIRYFNGNSEQVYIPITTTTGISYFGFKIDNMANESFDDTLRFVVQSGNALGQNGLNLTVSLMERFEEVLPPVDPPPTSNVPVAPTLALVGIGATFINIPLGVSILITSGGVYAAQKAPNAPKVREAPSRRSRGAKKLLMMP